MKLYEAKALIRDVFEHAFDKDRYTRLIKNLLKDIEEKTFIYQGNIIPNAFENYIRKMERIGKFEDEDGNTVDILIVELLREHSIEYARSAQRNFVRWYLSGSRGGQMKDAALVAFHSEKSSEWRFSLIKMQYSLESKKDEFTPAKRFSFLVGEKGKSHTAQRQLVTLLQSDDIPRLNDLDQAFNIESVTNEFFEKYKALVFNLVEELEKIIERDAAVKNEFKSKNIAVIDFAKKLMGQIVFLYFLQRKGWLGLKNGERYGDGDRHFLRSLYNLKQPGQNFFNDYLEYLFYEALSKKRVTDEYTRFNCRIPFLNGGLFDPINFYDWEKTDIVIPDHLFTNDNKTKEGDTGDGILDVFDLYNFTVNEAEPLDKEVAVDPEMLGKVFERMLDVKERKSKGAFYTPREIVHYMSQESLIHYLDTAVNQASSLNSPVTIDATVNQASSLRNQIDATSGKKNVFDRHDTDDTTHRHDACDTFMYFDPNAPTEIKCRNLPHWQQKGTAYFVTFRLYVSIPKDIADKIKREREQWFQKNKITDSSEVNRLNKDKRIEYHKLFSKRYDELLDNGHGSCVLAKPNFYALVENALKYFDNTRYQLDEYAIQPNHVHVIVIPKDDWTLSKITHSWKSYTANEINKILGREGTLWMAESFDHIIRSPRQLERIREYIINQASSLSNVTQTSNLKVNRKQDDGDDNKSHRQDVCDTVPKEDIEILIKHGEQLIDKDIAIVEERLKESANQYQIPESIRKHANEIDEALENIRVCDPAVGSGAFPVGVMTEIVKARQILTPFVTQSSRLSSEQDTTLAAGMRRTKADIGLEARSTYAFKSHCIHHNLYGVDIDPSAVEICKLRLWLSLVVDEQRIDIIEPLPNLDYKIVRGNSLINMPDGVAFDAQLRTEINVLMEKYYAETDKQAKRDLKDAIDGKIKQLLKSAEQFTNYPIDFDFKLFFHEVFKEKGGFDVVIGNPPYGASINDVEKIYLDNEFVSYKTSTKNSAIYFTYFTKKILNKNGVNTFIIPKSVCYSKGWNKCANYIHQNLIKLIDTGKAFEKVKLEQVIFVRNCNHSNEKFINGIYIDNSIKEFSQISKSVFKEYNVLLAGQSQKEYQIINKILSQNEHLFKEYVTIERGLNWQALCKKYPGETPVYRGAQLFKYFVSEPKDFINLKKFKKEDYSYQLNPKILNQLAIAHVQNPYPHFYLQATLDLDNKIVFETISCTFSKSNEIDLKFILLLRQLNSASILHFGMIKEATDFFLVALSSTHMTFQTSF